MRITIVTGPFYSLPPAPCGAIERLWHDLGRRFAAKGHEVTFLCRGWPGLPKDEAIDGSRYCRRSLYQRTGKLRWDLLKDLSYSLGMLRRLPPADLTVLNSFWLPVFASWRRSAGKMVFNVQRWPKGQMKFYHGVARLAAVSSAVAEEVRRQSPQVAAAIKIIPNPIDTDVFVPPKPGRLTRSTPIRTILYTGRVHPEKGVHLLLEAFKMLLPRFPHLRLRIVGPQEVGAGGGGDSYLQPLRKASAGLNVDFMPPIYDRAELARELQQADFYCYPSIAETGESFGVAPLEAMATGLAPIVSDLAVFRDFFSDGSTGLVFDHRSENAAINLAAALEQLVSDPERAARMGDAAIPVAARFSYDRIANMYLEDFQQLVNGT